MSSDRAESESALEQISEDEYSGSQRLRMLTVTLAAMTWATSIGILMYVTESWARKPAITDTLLMNVGLFCAYLITTRAPTLASGLLTVDRLVKRTQAGTDLYTLAAAALASITLAYTLFGALGGLMVVLGAMFVASTMVLALLIHQRLSRVLSTDDE